MNIEKMTKKDFENLSRIKYSDKFLDVDSIVLLPSRRMDQSGFRIYNVIPCKNFEPLGILDGYDTFSIYPIDDDRIGIDCLKCGLMRIFLPHHKYKVNQWYHEIIGANK